MAECGGSSEVATVQPKRERLPSSGRGTLAAVMPENHGVPGSNPGPATFSTLLGAILHFRPPLPGTPASQLPANATGDLTTGDLTQPTRDVFPQRLSFVFLLFTAPEDRPRAAPLQSR